MLHSLSLSKISTHHLSSLSLSISNMRYIDFWSVIRRRHVGPLHINSHKSQPFSPSAGWASPIPPRCVVCLPVRVRFSVHPKLSSNILRHPVAGAGGQSRVNAAGHQLGQPRRFKSTVARRSTTQLRKLMTFSSVRTKGSFSALTIVQEKRVSVTMRKRPNSASDTMAPQTGQKFAAATYTKMMMALLAVLRWYFVVR